MRTKLVNGQENVIYSYDGQVFCRCPETDVQRAMDYGGFERDRNTLKYRCPAPASPRTCGVWSDPPDYRPRAGHQHDSPATGPVAGALCPAPHAAPLPQARMLSSLAATA